jgi:hypothetical protein
MARIGETGRAATLNRSNVLALLESAAVVNQVLIEALLLPHMDLHTAFKGFRAKATNTNRARKSEKEGKKCP